MVSSFNINMRELLVHQGASPQSAERGLHEGIWWWEHQKLKGPHPFWQMVPSQARQEEALLKYLPGIISSRTSHLGTGRHLSIPAVTIMGGPAKTFSTTFNGHDSVRFSSHSACQYTAVHSLPPTEYSRMWLGCRHHPSQESSLWVALHNFLGRQFEAFATQCLPIYSSHSLYSKSKLWFSSLVVMAVLQ